MPPHDVKSSTRLFGRRGARRAVVLVAVAIAAYAVLAYVVAPALWRRYDDRHAALAHLPGLTQTGTGEPGDPLNVALIGSESQVKRVMDAAKWVAASPLGMPADLEIAVDSVLRRPDPDAPVSRLYLFGRVEDLAFEQEVGGSPRHRHHVRFWKTDSHDREGRPVWIGAAIYDRGVGFSRTTGQVTHRIDERIDDERNYLFRCLQDSNALLETDVLDDFHRVHAGRNGSGDPWVTDGRLFVGIISGAPDAVPQARPSS